MDGGRYRLGPTQPATPGNMWEIIRGYVSAQPDISHRHLINAMMGRPKTEWPKRVLDDPSKQGVGSEIWCNGYINGAVREGYLLRV